MYSILEKVPPGKVYIKVLQSETSDKLPLELNDALTKLQNERQILDKKMPVKLKSTGTASTLSAASESSESCGKRFSFDVQVSKDFKMNLVISRYLNLVLQHQVDKIYNL